MSLFLFMASKSAVKKMNVFSYRYIKEGKTNTIIL